MQKHVYMSHAPKGLLYCFDIWSAAHTVWYALHEWARPCCQLDLF